MNIERTIKELSTLEDPRRQWGNIRHRLMDILFIALCSTICAGENFDEMEDFGQTHSDWLKQYIELPNGIPDSDTFRRVFERLDSNQLMTCLENSLLEVGSAGGRLVNIDGKTICGSKKGGESALHVVSAWVHEQGITLGQLGAKGKGEELNLIPELLDSIDIEGDIVTIDAIGCQKDITETIRGKQADYVLSVKRNQPYLYEQIEEYFTWVKKQQPKEEKIDRWMSPIEKKHGRIEKRTVWATNSVEWLQEKEKWKDIAAIIQYSCEKEVNGKQIREEHYYISSFETTAEQYAYLIRNHWSIENGLHWMLDVTFREDQQKVHKDNSPMNMNILRKFALSLLKKAPEPKKRTSIRRRMLRAAWDPQYLQLVLFGF